MIILNEYHQRVHFSLKRKLLIDNLPKELLELQKNYYKYVYMRTDDKKQVLFFKSIANINHVDDYELLISLMSKYHKIECSNFHKSPFHIIILDIYYRNKIYLMIIFCIYSFHLAFFTISLFFFKLICLSFKSECLFLNLQSIF